MQINFKSIFTNKFFIITFIIFAILFSFLPFSHASSNNGAVNNGDGSFTFSIIDYYGNTHCVNLNLGNSFDLEHCYYCYSSIKQSYPLSPYDDRIHGFLYFSNTPFIVNYNENENGSVYYTLSNNDNSSIYYIEPWFPLNGNSNVVYDSLSSIRVIPNTSREDFYFRATETITDNSQSSLFQVTPQENNNQQGEQQETGQMMGVQILTQETGQQIPQGITRVLPTVIQVGLAIFGIGLVIYLMRLLILRLM